MFLVPLILLSCNKPPAETTDTREPIAIQYVGGQTAPVHVQPDDKARIVTRYQHGESVPVLAKKGDWAEVRTAMGSGWVHQSDLVNAEEAESRQTSLTPKFLRPPAPVTSPSVHGTIYIEADVNTDGDVTATRIISNTTGSESLALQNVEALKRAKFYPIVQKGERKPFEYYYRVDY